MKVSAKSIAQELGVSQATVSLVMRNLPGVGESTRQLILDKAREMGYEKMPTAQPEELRFITLILYKKHGGIITDNPFFSRLVQGVDLSAKKYGYQIIVNYIYGNQDISEQLQALSNAPSIGYIIIATEMTNKDIEPILKLGKPVVVLDRYFPDFDVDCVSINNTYGVKRAVKHLIDMGHRRIGYLHCSIKIRNFQERNDGFYRGLRTLQGDLSKSPVILSVSADTETAVLEMEKYLKNNPVIPSAFFADTDEIAIPFMNVLQRFGLRVPDDVSIIGFDDMPYCTMQDPPLSSMAIRLDEMAQTAVDCLIRRINNTDSSSLRVEIMPTLVSRGSVMRRN